MVQRYAQIIGIRPECIAEYERMHVTVWPEVLRTIRDCNMRNYSIFRHGTTLFAYFEYVGNDFDADMMRMAADPKTQEWWSYTDPMQVPLPDRDPGTKWVRIPEVFHTD